MQGYVYELQIGDYKQIGSTGDLEKRKHQHLVLLKQNRHYNRYLQRVYNKTKKPVKVVVLSSHTTREEAYLEEQKLLDLYYRKPYYTMEHPFATGGSKPGKDSFMYGKKHSEEVKRKIGAKQKGKIISKETRDKLKEQRLGKVNCRDRYGNKKTVTKEEFDKRPDLIGITAGIEKPNARKVIRCLETGKVYQGVVEASKALNVPPGQISENLKGKRARVALRKYPGGLTFELLPEQ